MARRSAGLLLYRGGGTALEVLLVHPGGPYWTNKDLGGWSIPKGEFAADEDPLTAARREFFEETGYAPAPPFLPLGEVQQAGGKRVYAFAAEGDLDPSGVRSNMFDLEWPPGCGDIRQFREIDRAAWFGLDEARTKINRAQVDFLDTLARRIIEG